MTNRKSTKLLPVWIAISAVIIIAGIILFALLGFNNTADRPASKTFDISSEVRVEVSDREEELERLCEEAFQENGLKFEEKVRVPEVDGNYLSDTGRSLLQYTFAGETDAELLNKAAASAKTKIEAAFADMDIAVTVHTLENETFTEAAWRGAVAIAVGAVVALIYIGIRFGVGAALTGLTACVHDVFFTLAFFAITRIPVYTAGVMLYGAIAAAVSLVLWLIQCMKLRENRKDEAFAALPAEEAVETSSKAARKTILAVAGAFAGVFVVLSAVAAAGVRLMVLPMLVPVAVAVYSSLLFAPALHVHVKKGFDKRKAKRKPRYVGKQKNEKIRQD